MKTGTTSKTSETTSPKKHRKLSGAAAPEAIPAATPTVAASLKLSAPIGAGAAPNLQPREITADDIARLAYSFWLDRGSQNGSPEQDWLRAERELALID